MSEWSSLLAIPLWRRRVIRWLSGQTRRAYFVYYDRGEIAYEDGDRSVVIYAEQLGGDPERIIHRRNAFIVSQGTRAPVDDRTWDLISRRVVDDLNARRITWLIDDD